MNAQQVKEVGAHVLAQAEDELRRTGEVQPMLVVIRQEHAAIFWVPYGLPTEVWKRSAVALLHAAAEAGADAVGMVTDAWWAPASSDPAIDALPPSQRADRGEELMVNLETRHGAWVVQRRYERTADGRPVLPDEPAAWHWGTKSNPGLVGRMAGYYPATTEA